MVKSPLDMHALAGINRVLARTVHEVFPATSKWI